MKKYRLNVALVAFAFSVSIQDSLADSSSNKFSFPVPNTTRPPGYTPPVIGKTPLQQQSVVFVNALQDRVYKNWEPDGFSNGKVMVVEFKIDSNGYFHDINVPRYHQSPQADFAAIEAVSESSGFSKNVPKDIIGLSIEVNLKRKAGERSTYDSVDTDTLRTTGFQRVVWHLIPLDALNCNPQLDVSIVHGKGNLFFVDPENRQLKAARLDWVNYLRSSSQKGLTAKALKKEANIISQKYPSLVKEKVGTGL